ncbi:MAG: helix-turn-helix transcriptional regulator [Nitrososphaeraceae archaeon]
MSSARNNLEWRRNKVLELSSQGLTQSEIATVLKITQPTVNKDLTSIKKKATANLQRHIQETLPHEYQKCMVGINQVLKMAWSIVSTQVDDKTSLQALALINDCNKYKMDLTTNGVVITDAIKFVHINKEKLTMSAKEDDNGKESSEPDYDEDKDQLEEKQEEETGELKEETTNHVF